MSVITKYAVEVFTESDWYTFGQICGKLDSVTGHPRLLRSMGFGDPDYEYSAAQVVDSVLYDDSRLIGEVIQHFDIDLTGVKHGLECGSFF